MNFFFNDAVWQATWQEGLNRITQYCRRCVYSNITPGIIFDNQGICNYCHQHDDLMRQYDPGKTGQKKFEMIIEQIKQAGKRKKYDIIVGVSGGVDSSYMLYLAKQYGLRPLAVHFDNTWNSTIAVENIHNVLEKLEVELWTYVVDNEEYDDLYRAILQAGVPDLEAPTDLALAVTLNKAAAKFGVRYIFEGHSFQTEGLSPLGWLYMDAKYVHSMHQQFGSMQRLKSYPYMWLSLQLKWMLLNRFKKIRPFWYIQYSKAEAKGMLQKNFGWQWYGGHHLENRITAFYHTYFLPRRFGIDQRANSFAAAVRSGHMDRESALSQLQHPPLCDKELVEMVLKRLKLTNEEFLNLMTLPVKFYKDYPTYKPTFEKMRPFFYLMAKFDFIPMSFYLKYTAK